MRAIVQDGYGEPTAVLRLREHGRPQPRGGEVLVRVAASSVNPADRMVSAGRPYVLRAVFGLSRPRHRVPGKDVAGTVEEVGPGVTRFRPGDEVFGELPSGAYAEYAVAGQDLLAHKPESVAFTEAAAVPVAGVAALQGVRDAGGVRPDRPGLRVLVNGASGGVGTFAMQIAKAYGAHVTAACGAHARDLVLSIGADEALDRAGEDLGHGYDVVFDLAGDRPLRTFRRALRSGGVYVAATGRPGGAVLGPLPYLGRVGLSSLGPSPRMRVFAAKQSADDLAELARLMDEEKVAPVIEAEYPLARTAEALTTQARGRRRGKTVVNVAAS
ncbi:NAD(P)-dependent alcohol dehydrogenase [Nocardiopsis chromatogenes]|uniref:NAD(P)-dependent alcohol dehydrogenase n=1 Tax=Nocardiopsis chromatogenes TaxID=280239 RepID=UPI00034924E1|nr:NAD(P)-dependent alcohol dehydrogenase [Nocardiopsis chromatogenes]